MLTHDEILNIAKAEGYYLAEYDTPDGVVVHVRADGCITDLLEKVAAAAAAKEREACAKVCESIYTNGDAAEGWMYIAADKIRDRNNKDNQQ